MSLSLRAGRAALAEGYGNDAITPYSSDHGAVLLALCSELCSVR